MHKDLAVTVVATVFFLSLIFLGLPTDAHSQLSDNLTHEPPSDGPYPFSPPGDWLPGTPGFLAKGDTYRDPVFGGTIRRLTDEYPETGVNNYAKNGFWNANSTLTIRHDSASKIINATTGDVVRDNVPGSYEGSFAPNNADIWYYFSGSSLRQYRVSTGQNSLVKTFPGTLGSLGASVDWIDRTGKYMLLRIGGDLRIWDKQANILYSGSVSGGGGSGWAGISPDGKYIITAGSFAFHSYKINHTNRSIVLTSKKLFWTLCGDHADIITASSGKTYIVVFNCWDQPEVYRVDVTIAQQASNVPKQKSDNLKLFDTKWEDSGHFSCVSKGTRRDWCFISTESIADVDPWYPYKDEIVAANVLTGEVRRYAHHRSRDMGSCYYCQPRVQASWDGSKAIFASNYGATDANDGEYGELYVLELE